MGTKPDPNAENQKPSRHGAYVPSTIRYSPAELRMLDAIVADIEADEGRPMTRAAAIREWIRREFRRRFPDRPYPTDARKRPPGGK